MSTELVWHDIRDAAALAALESEWWDLWHRAAAATPFQSPAWLLPWWDAFAPGELLVLTARRAGRLIALAPFYLDHGNRVLPVGISVSDYHDVLVDDAHADPVHQELGARMVDCEPRWTTWEFLELPPDAQALRTRMPEGCDDSVEAASACPVLRLPDSTAALAEVYPARKRRALRLARNRAARRGGIDIVAARDPAAALGMLATLIRLHGARWQAQGGAGVLADPRVRDFHRRSVQRSSRAGWLRLLELRIAGAVAAVYYGFQHRGCAYGYLTGFDPAYDYESPGVILLAAAMERAIRDGAREFHFLRGREAYKYGWGAEDRWNRRRVFRRRESYARAS